MPSPTICCVRSRRPSARALIAPFSEALELRTALNTAFETDRRSREGDRNAPLLPSPLLKTLECTRSPNFLTASRDDTLARERSELGSEPRLDAAAGRTRASAPPCPRDDTLIDDDFIPHIRDRVALRDVGLA